MISASARAKQSEYLARNNLGQIVCKLCSTIHRDAENFILHLESKRHATNIGAVQRAAAAKQLERDALMRMQDTQSHTDQAAALGLSANNNATTVAGAAGLQPARRLPRIGRPKVTHHTDNITGPGGEPRCRVLFELTYPLASTEADATMRPMHRWLSTHEQSVEPKDEEQVYLLFACEPYETVAFTFPARLPVTTAETARRPGGEEEFFCQWDPVHKVYTLMFVIG